MRKEKEIVIVDDGQERCFVIKQMSALAQEDWINRAVALLMAKSNENLDNIINAVTEKEDNGIQMLLALFNGIKYDEIKDLYNELLNCVSYKPDINNNSFLQPLSVQNVESIIVDVKTLYKLRLESFKLNFSFFLEGLSSNNEKPVVEENNSITIRKITNQ